MMLFLAITHAYHHPATRLKRWMVLAYEAEGIAALSCLLFGAIRQTSPVLPASGPLALGFVLVPFDFALCSPFKDYKDVELDRKASVQTLYVALANRGVVSRRTNLVVAATLSLSTE